jgi:hypothetical protein
MQAKFPAARILFLRAGLFGLTTRGTRGFDGGRCRDRTCDPSRVKGVTPLESLAFLWKLYRNSGRFVPLSDTAAVLRNLRALRISGELQGGGGPAQICRAEAGVDLLCHPAVAVSEHLCDLTHRDSSLSHRAGGRVAEDVSRHPRQPRVSNRFQARPPFASNTDPSGRDESWRMSAR